jgi:hypothetical protein
MMNTHATIVDAYVAALADRLACGGFVALDAFSLRSWAARGFPLATIRAAAEGLAGQGAAAFTTGPGGLRLVAAEKPAEPG